MQYQHIIWDYNGTLLNDVNLCVNIINELLSARDLPMMSVDKYRELFDFPVKDYYAKAGFDFEKESFETVGTEFIVQYDKRQKKAQLHLGVLELLKEIHEKGIQQSVLSARKEEQLTDELKAFGIYHLFQVVVGLNDHYAGGKTGRGKDLMSEINTPKDQILMIGDTKHDAEVAKALGIDCVLLSHGHHTKEKLETCGLTVLSGIDHLKAFIFNGK